MFLQTGGRAREFKTQPDSGSSTGDVLEEQAAGRADSEADN
jgi:hypothetical protein